MPAREPKVALVITKNGLDNITLLGESQIARQRAIQIYQAIESLIDKFGECAKMRLDSAIKEGRVDP